MNEWQKRERVEGMAMSEVEKLFEDWWKAGISVGKYACYDRNAKYELFITFKAGYESRVAELEAALIALRECGRVVVEALIALRNSGMVVVESAKASSDGRSSVVPDDEIDDLETYCLRADTLTASEGSDE